MSSYRRIVDFIVDQQRWVGAVGALLSWVQQYFFSVLPLKESLKLEAVLVATIVCILVGIFVTLQPEELGREAHSGYKKAGRRYALLALILFIVYIILTQIVETTGRGGRIETTFEQLLVACFVAIWASLTASAANLILAWRSTRARRSCSKGHVFFDPVLAYCPYCQRRSSSPQSAG